MRLYFPLTTLAKITGRSIDTLRNQARKGVIPSVKMGRQHCVPRAFLLQLITAAGGDPAILDQGEEK